MSTVLKPSRKHCHGRCSAPRTRLFRSTRRAAVRAVNEEEEVDERVSSFLREQDLAERGAETRATPDKVIGAEEVDEEQAKALCRDIVRILRLLKEKRDMDVREAKLVIAIDDPGNDQKRAVGIEDSRGVSRDEVSASLEDVAAGRIPKDRLALRVLHNEMVNWPFLESDASAEAPAGVEVKQNEKQGRYAGADSGRQLGSTQGSDKAEGEAGFLSGVMGYGTLYAVTLVPIGILGAVIAILFFSSLK